MRTLSGAEYRHVQALERGFSVLTALNRAEEGRATTRELSERTHLHRTTVRRLLETLLSQGYVRRSESDDSYRLNLKVRELSEGFTDDEWIAVLATPALGELLKIVVWPSDLTTLDGTSMIIRETTHRFSIERWWGGGCRCCTPLPGGPILAFARRRSALSYCKC